METHVSHSQACTRAEPGDKTKRFRELTGLGERTAPGRSRKVTEFDPTADRGALHAAAGGRVNAPPAASANTIAMVGALHRLIGRRHCGDRAPEFVMIFGVEHRDVGIRNGDIDGNPATELEATWQPIDNTPLHPEYPCAHCINSGAAVAVIESVLGSADIPEVSMTSSTAPGVIHHWTNLGVFADEGCECPHLGRVPLPVLDPRRHGYGTQDR